MALFFEGMLWCAQTVLDTADIVRDGDFAAVTPARWDHRFVKNRTAVITINAMTTTLRTILEYEVLVGGRSNTSALTGLRCLFSPFSFGLLHMDSPQRCVQRRQPRPTVLDFSTYGVSPYFL
jgi:hypothetical protein